MKPASPRRQFAEECLYTALVQLMEEKPYADITVTDIAKRAGVSRMAYYRNYASKDEILVRRIDAMFTQVFAQMSAAAPKDMRDFWRLFLSNFADAKALSLALEAGLFELVWKRHEAYAVKMFTEVLHWELETPYQRTVFLYQLGGLTAMIRAMVARDEDVDIECLLDAVEHCFPGEAPAHSTQG